MMKLWPVARRQFLYIQVCLLAAVILWLTFAHLWLLKAVAMAAGMWFLLVFVYYHGSTYFKEIHKRANPNEIRQFYIFLALFYLFILWLVIALKFDRLHPR
jgi:hypothetical protein